MLPKGTKAQKAPLLTKEGWHPLRVTGWFSRLGSFNARGNGCREPPPPATAVPLLRKEGSPENTYRVIGQPSVGGFVLEAAGEVVFVPAGLDEDDRGIRFQPGVDVVVEPVPDAVAMGLALGVGSVADRVVDDDQPGAKTGDTGSDTDGTDAASVGRFPFGCGVERRCGQECPQRRFLRRDVCGNWHCFRASHSCGQECPHSVRQCGGSFGRICWRAAGCSCRE